jgi:hypothetical protein
MAFHFRDYDAQIIQRTREVIRESRRLLTSALSTCGRLGISPLSVGCLDDGKFQIFPSTVER